MAKLIYLRKGQRSKKRKLRFRVLYWLVLSSSVFSNLVLYYLLFNK